MSNGKNGGGRIGFQDGHRPAPSGIHKPGKVSGGYQAPTGELGPPPSGGSGGSEPKK